MLKKTIIIILIVLLVFPAASLAVKENDILGTWAHIVEFSDGDTFITIYHFLADHYVFYYMAEINHGQVCSSVERVCPWEINYGNIVIHVDDVNDIILEYSDRDNVLFGGTFDERCRKIYSRYKKDW